MTVNQNSIRNQLLNALPKADYDQLAPHLIYVSLERGTIIAERGEPLEYAYFPNSAMISSVITMENGSTTETSLVDYKGMVDLPIVLGNNRSISQEIVQVSGTATKLKGSILQDQFQQGGNLQRILLLYTQARLFQVAQLSACNRQHTTQERLARWLLTVQESIDQDELPLTQEFLAEMLGTRRSGVTIAANILQNAGLIRYHRGKITIINQDELENVACECHQLIKNAFLRLF